MDLWSSKLYFATWTVMSLLGVFSHEVTVKNSDLKLCKDDERVCVTDLRDCGPRPASSIQKTLNMTCYHTLYTSMTCELSQASDSHAEPDVSLIFSSVNKIISCHAIFNPASTLNVTARIMNYLRRSEIRSQPHTVFVYEAVKPSPPVLTVLGSTDDSVVVSWRSSSDGSCRLRYRVDGAQTWSQSPGVSPVFQHQEQVYTIKHLLPFTVYRAAVACRKYHIWSNWSPDVTVRTLDRAPSRPPEVCYRVERADSPHLHLMWKEPDLREAGGRGLGYQVSCRPARRQRPQDTLIQNVTGAMAPLEVKEGNYSVTVRAFNSAGFGPAAQLSIDTQTQNNLPSVRDLWVSSSFPAAKDLLVQWELSAAPPPALPVGHFNVQLRSEVHPSASRWSTVDGSITSTVIQDVDPDESYLVSVIPVYKQQCGSPLSLNASLQQGALMEAFDLNVVDVTKTWLTVKWAWQRKSGPIRVNRYRVMLKKNSERHNTVLSFPPVSLWWNQSQHTFLNLTPATEYSLLLLADDVSRNIITVTTNFDEVPVVATVTPLLLLAVIVLIISILSRTVYKSYFFPPISSPRGSTTGQWLMHPNHQFQVTDVLGEKSAIVIGPNSPFSSEEDLHENTSLLPPGHLIIKLSGLKLDAEYVSDTPLTTELQLQSYNPDYAVNCHHSDKVFVSEERREADAAQAHEGQIWFPWREEVNMQLDLSQISYQTEAAVKCSFHELMTKADSRCDYQITCEAQYVLNSSFLGKSDVETESGHIDCSYLICDTDYIANSCFTAKTAVEDRASSISIVC
ncbi:interleukin-6 receptor subunit beta isoform X2 [Lates calcarifer]|uniref:Interleukin-6 receptor subunit beta isoform X2 n=1 Tax=Lates calcarifer TaxID=8187 RepID=A0AAJ8BD46_LATCA|nr:interleukin-6 receptor subunit beta isoform X2 [Lates calcarifer]